MKLKEKLKKYPIGFSLKYDSNYFKVPTCYYKNKVYDLKCVTCGKDCQVKHKNSKYCPECKKAKLKKKIEKRHCHHCGTYYQPVRELQRFCNSYCRIENRNKRLREGK